MSTNKKMMIVFVCIVASSVLIVAQSLGLKINPNGTLDPISVSGDITATGTVQAQSGYGYVPVGTILPWYCVGTSTALPPGWYKCDGQTVNGLTNGGASDMLDNVSDGKFVVPNLNANSTYGSRGLFLRGGATAGTIQDDAFQGHAHLLTAPAFGGYINNVGGGFGASIGRDAVGSNNPAEASNWKTSDIITNGTNGAPKVANETRPVNMTVVWIIRVL